MNIDQIVILADENARSEITKYGLPSLIHYTLSQQIGSELAEKISADVNIVKIGTSLMDYKLGEAFKAGKLKEHVKMSVDAAQKLLEKIVDENVLARILHCIEAHHGTVPFQSIEAEICANADCYRFIHPVGSLTYLATLGKRQLSHAELLKQSRSKLEEKWSILSLDICKNDLNPYFKSLKKLLDGTEDYLHILKNT
jgi:hypothetical protein